MVHSLSKSEIEIEFTKATQETPDLYLPIGLFFKWFGAVDLQVSRILSHVLKIRNFEKFDILTRRLDISAKYERLREACSVYSPMGPNLHDRLDYLDRHCRKMRNHLAHCFVQVDKSIVYCNTMSATRVKAPDKVRPNNLAPTSYTLIEIKRNALWLRDFFDDLEIASRETWHGRRAEIKNPKSNLPAGFQARDRRKSRRAKAHKPQPKLP